MPSTGAVVTHVEVVHGVDAVGVWGEHRGHRFGFVLTPDEADSLSARLAEQARYARDLTAAKQEPSR